MNPGKKEQETTGNQKSLNPPQTGKILAGILTATIMIAVWIGVRIWTDYRDSIIDQQKQQMSLTVQSLRDHMEVFIQEYSADLDGLCQTALSEGSVPDWELLQSYVDSHSRFVCDILVEQSEYAQAESANGSRIQEVCSVSMIDQDRSFCLVRLEHGEMDLVLRRNLENHGSVSIVINLETYYETLIKNLRIGSSGYVVLKDADGIILMHPERAQWGIDVIEGRMAMYSDLNLDSLKQMIDHQKKGLEGVEEYYSYWWTKPGYPRVQKISAYAPVWIGEDFLILSEVIDYDDIYIPIASGMLKMGGFLFLIFAVLISMIFYMAYLSFQKQKDKKQIAYLTELNRILEEMHRSEETIAHQQRLQIMGTMTGGIAHEFNNLLTPIMGYADLLMMELPEDSEPYENAREICEASAKAKEMIQQISSLSRKNMETAYKHMNAGQMVMRALKMVRSVCPSNVRMEEQIHLEQAWILCNETQMNQVILNICVNAFHAMERREGLLKIQGTVIDLDTLLHLQERSMTKVSGEVSRAAETWTSYICITIQDNGCGMSEKVLNQIFDPFFTTKKGGKGTGLGLSLVEQIIHSHKGYIFVESQPEKGTIFCLCLPVTESDRQGNGAAGQDPYGLPEKLSDIGSQGLHFLIVDDNPKVLRLLEKEFTKFQIPLECCMTFAEARDFLKSQKGSQVSVLVAEQEISGQNAVDFCMSIQGRQPELIRIIMADRVTREILEARQRRIIDGCIDKPVSVASILEAVQGSLNNL